MRLWGEGKVKTGGGIRTIAETVAEIDGSGPADLVTVNYEWWAGPLPTKPKPADFIPDGPDDQRTHCMMYENTTEGTPISPAFETAELLARWLADNRASAFAGCTATYDEWLSAIKRGVARSAHLQSGELTSGVSAMHKVDQ